MVSVWTGAVDDGWNGTLGWFWAACAVTTIVLVFVTKAALTRALVLGRDGRHRTAVPGDPHRVRHRPRRPRRARRLTASRPGRHRTIVRADVCRMPRPVWSGTISFGLVAIPIKLFHAVSKKSVSFNQLDERTMSRIRYKKVSAETGEDVPDEHIVKGYEISKGRYVTRRPRRARAVHPVGHPHHRPRGVRRSRRDRPGLLRRRLLPGARRNAQAVRAAGPGDGGGRQGRHRPLRDAQQAVHGGDPGHRRAADDVDAGVRRRGRRPADSIDELARPRRRRRHRQGGQDGRGAGRVAVGRVRARRSTATTTASRCST